MEYTIKEIAEKVGVSKTAINKKIANLGLQTKLVKKGNKFVIDKENANIIISAFRKENENQNTQTSSQTKTIENTIEVIGILKEQLAIKDQQIIELNERLKEAHQLNANNQILIERVRQKSPKLLEEKDETQEKKKWWHFGKNKA